MKSNILMDTYHPISEGRFRDLSSLKGSFKERKYGVHFLTVQELE